MTTTPAEPYDRIEPVGLEVEMQRSYLDYAMSVIVGRALPDVRDGLKPVHRRVLYAMYDGGYRPDRGYFKCARVVGDVMGNYHPHGDTAIYDTLVRLAQPWSMRMPLVDGNGNFGSPGNDAAAAMRYTECRLAPLAMEMLRGIDEETVDFQPNYDGRSAEPVVLPSRYPNLLVNGSAGIAVGMATNIPPHNLREVAAGVTWYLENPEADDAALLEALLERVPGPDFPTSALIVGREGIEQAYRTGRGSVRTRAVVEVVEQRTGGAALVVTELPYQVNPDNLALKIAELTREGRLAGIRDITDESSARTGMRLVIHLKRDARPRVVLNNLYKHTQLQDSFGVNMLAIVDGVPRTLRLDQVVRHYVAHQVDVLQRRTRFRLRRAEERAHVLRAYAAALARLDDVIALIRAAESAEAARAGLMELLGVDEVQATAVLNLQLRRLAQLETQALLDELAEREAEIADLRAVLDDPARQRRILAEELADLTEKYGDARRTRFVADEGDVDAEDLIAREDVVVTVTRSGYAKRTKVDAYRQQRRGGKGVQGASQRTDDIVEHFFVTSTHTWLLFFTDRGRVYRCRAHALPEGARNARGQHVANVLAMLPEETISQVLVVPDYGGDAHLAVATRRGLVKKTPLADFDSPRSGGLIAVNLRAEDALIGAALVEQGDDILLVSRNAQSIRFSAGDDQLRPMGRATSGVIGMRFTGDDELLSMSVVRGDGGSLLTATEGGFAKRTRLSAYARQGRGGMGVLTHRVVSTRGRLVAALVVQEGDQLFAITSGGGVIRTRVDSTSLRDLSRQSMGVRLIDLPAGDTLLGVARNAESTAEEEPA